MKYRTPIIAALSLAVAVAIAAPVVAQEWTGKAPTAAQQQQLDAARAKLDAAAKDYAELARQYGIERQAIDIQRRLLRKPVIGVVLAPDAKAGVHIVGVTPGSAAAEAGLKSGDRIIAIDGKALAGSDAEARVESARQAIGRHDDKSKVQLRYLRAEHEATVVVTPKPGERMMFLPDGMPLGDSVEFRRNFRTFELPDGRMEFEGEDMHAVMPAVAPRVQREVMRLGAEGDCKGRHCKIPVIAEAMRWNGLNLATVDADLGKYFGSEDGVLVLSTGPELKGLQPGDVIRKVDGKAVDSPREVMSVLRGRKSGTKVAIEYMRDHTLGNTQVEVPKPMQFRIPAPPAPPAHPAMPAPPAPPAAPPRSPLPPPGVAHIDKFTFLSDDIPPPPAPPAPPSPPTPPLPVD